MKEKNGFVLAETLIVVILLTITLMSLYTSFSSIVNRTRSKSNNDTIDTIYKTTFVKDLLDSNYINSRSLIEYTDSLTYYAMNNTTRCVPHSYSNGFAISFANDGNALVACDFTPYLNGVVVEGSDSDPLYDVVNAYKIEKMYLVNFGAINSNGAYNIMDASAIDYVLSKHKKLTGDHLVIKYRKNYVYPSDYMRVDEDFEPVYDYYYSSVQMNSIKIDISSSPIYLYESPAGDAQKMVTQSLADNEKYILPSENSFTNHAGQVIIGWTNTSEFVEQSKFNACMVNRANNEKRKKYCYKVGEKMTVNSDNRTLYAVWCGTGSLRSALSCQVDANISTDNGAIREVEPNYGDTNIVYRGTGGDNYVRIGDYCYRMVSTFGSSDSIKTIYYGTFNHETGKCDNKSSIVTTSTVAFNSGFDYNSYAWMYKEPGASYGFGGVEDISQLVNTMDVVEQKVLETKPCPYDAYCLFGSKVKYDAATDTYTLLGEDDNETTYSMNFAGFSANKYSDLDPDDWTYRYVCEGGQTTTCKGAVYYYQDLTYLGWTNAEHTKYYKFKHGYTKDNYLDVQLFASSKAEYKNGKYYLDSSPSNSITYSIRDYGNASADLNLKLRTYKYMCPDAVMHDDGVYTCEKVALILNRYSYGSYLLLSNGMLTQTEYNKYLNGQLSERTKSSTIKTQIDKFYENNLKSVESILDQNVTFCNNLEETNNNDLGNLQTDSFSITNKYYTYSNPNGLIGKYRNCDSENQYLYSTSSENGNGLNKYPIGMLTYEEATYVSKNRYSLPGGNSHYLSDSNGYFLMNPATLGGGHSTSSAIWTSGYQISGGVIKDDADGKTGRNVRPVIGIKLDIDVKQGTGSYNNPFVLN